MASALTILIVTDPLCSWCWGMAGAVDAVRHRLRDRVAFDLVLGGINTDSALPVGRYGRRLMQKLWHEVAQTTAQRFAELPAADYVHNSLPVCIALEAVRVAANAPPFECLHELQRRFFTEGQNTTDPDFLAGFVAGWGIPAASFSTLSADPALLARVRFQFDMAGAFGTQALPSVLCREGGETRLLAGGYLDDAMLEAVILQAAWR